MTIKIDKGIPFPLAGVRTIYPFRDLEPGDSFFVPGKTTTRLAGSVSSAKKRLGIRLACRTENGGVRVWRLPDDEQEES